MKRQPRVRKGNEILIKASVFDYGLIGLSPVSWSDKLSGQKLTINRSNYDQSFKPLSWRCGLDLLQLLTLLKDDAVAPERGGEVGQLPPPPHTLFGVVFIITSMRNDNISTTTWRSSSAAHLRFSNQNFFQNWKCLWKYYPEFIKASLLNFSGLLHCVISQLLWFKNQKLLFAWFVYMHITISIFMRKKESFDSFIIGFFKYFRQSPYPYVCKPFFP